MWRHADMQACRYACMQIWKYASLQVCKYAGMQLCKHAGMQVCILGVCLSICRIFCLLVTHLLVPRTCLSPTCNLPYKHSWCWGMSIIAKRLLRRVFACVSSNWQDTISVINASRNLKISYWNAKHMKETVRKLLLCCLSLYVTVV